MLEITAFAVAPLSLRKAWATIWRERIKKKRHLGKRNLTSHGLKEVVTSELFRRINCFFFKKTTIPSCITGSLILGCGTVCNNVLQFPRVVFWAPRSQHSHDDSSVAILQFSSHRPCLCAWRSFFEDSMRSSPDHAVLLSAHFWKVAWSSRAGDMNNNPLWFLGPTCSLPPQTIQSRLNLVSWWWLKYIYTGYQIYSASEDRRLTFSSDDTFSKPSQSELGFCKEKVWMLKCLLSCLT